MSRAFTVIISTITLLILCAESALGAGFRARTVSGETFPGDCVFMVQQQNDSVNDVINSVTKWSNEGKVFSYFPDYALDGVKDMLRQNTEQYYLSYICHTYFKVKGYVDSIGAVTLSVDGSHGGSTTFKYIAMIGVIYKNGDVEWFNSKASYVNGYYDVRISTQVASLITREGRTCVVFIVGETYKWW